ncbi:MAG: hypothetical protein ACT4PT_03080 [Methanobacteriota archaeon]
MRAFVALAVLAVLMLPSFGRSDEPLVTIDLIPPTDRTHLRVLLSPAPHGDPAGPDAFAVSGLEYTFAARIGIHDWERHLSDYLADHPEHAYLRRIALHVDPLEGPGPVTLRPGEDVAVAWLETGAGIFRGLEADTKGNGFVCPSYIGVVEDFFPEVEPVVPDEDPVAPLACKVWEKGVHRHVRDPQGAILLTIFNRWSWQPEYDFAKASDIRLGAAHEMIHALGVGHVFGPVNDIQGASVAGIGSRVWGDGDPTTYPEDGRRPYACPSNLDYMALAYVYSWLETGRADFPRPHEGVTLSIPLSEYKQYC